MSSDIHIKKLGIVYCPKLFLYALTKTQKNGIINLLPIRLGYRCMKEITLKEVSI